MNGFNKIEILVAVGLISGCLVVGLIGFLNVEKNLRDSKRKADIGVIAGSLETHYNTKVDQFCNNSPAGSYCHPKLTWFQGGVPRDPLLGDYINLPQDGDKQYLICAKLEGEGGNSASSDGTLVSGSKSGYFCQRNAQ